MFWIKIWISLFITTIRNFYGQSLIRILQIHFDSVSRALFWVKNFQVNIAHSQFHKRENKMKFFTCCSNKIETQTVEPQVLRDVQNNISLVIIFSLRGKWDFEMRFSFQNLISEMRKKISFQNLTSMKWDEILISKFSLQ